MLTFESILGGAVTVILYAFAALAVYRVFQMGSDLSEVKELLKAIKSNTEKPTPAVPPPPHNSPEALVRAVHAASYEELDTVIGQQTATRS